MIHWNKKQHVLAGTFLVPLQERKRGLVIAERQEKEMQRVVENEQRMGELQKKILRIEEVRY